MKPSSLIPHHSYLFVLGRETELCFAELETLLGVFEPTATIQKLSTDVVLVQRALSEAGLGRFDPQWWQNRLGGTRLIARALDTVSAVSAEVIHELLDPAVREVALSGPTVSVAERRKLLQRLKQLRPTLRYRENHDAYLASGLSERLIRREDGAEVLIAVSPHGSIIAQVVAVQDTRAWTERDRGLPAPDAFVGMLPPKVARIMVNLAEPARKRRALRGESREHAASADLSNSPLSSQRSTLLDPFCGSGQIPIEGLRLGWTVIASDLDERGIERTRTNLAWAQERSVAAAGQTWTACVSDIATITDHVQAGSIDAIVTEPDLGPPLQSSTAVPSERVLDGVAATIAAAFDAGRAVIRAGGRLVIVIPIIAGNRIADRLLDPEGNRWVDDSVRSGYTLRATLHYARPDSRVEREIYVFDKV